MSDVQPIKTNGNATTKDLPAVEPRPPRTPSPAVRPASRWKRRLVVAAVVLTGLFAVELGTYLAWAEAKMPSAGIPHLWVFRDGQLFRGSGFVVVDGETWRSLSDAQKAELTAVLLKHVPTLYHSMDEVPLRVLPLGRLMDFQEERLKQRIVERGLSDREAERERAKMLAGNRGMSLAGYGGTKFSWFLLDAGFLWMDCWAGEYHSGLGAEFRRDIYVWVLGRWVRVWRLGGQVS
jgi:hypothetical protein